MSTTSHPLDDDNFPVGRIPDAIYVTSRQLATLFHHIDALRPLLVSDEARHVLTQLELRVEEMTDGAL